MAMFANSVLFLPTAGGTTDFTVSAAVTGFMTPALAGMPSGTYKYRAESTGLTQWEIGEGVYDSGTGVLTRATVLYNSSGTGTATGQSGAGSKINFSVPPNVGVVQLVGDTLGVDQANSWSVAQKIQVKENVGVQKNYILNGAMMVSQQNGSAVGTTSNYYTVDQFAHYVSAGPVVQASQVASSTPGGSPNRIRSFVATPDASLASSDTFGFSTYLEGNIVADLLFGTANAKTITIAFGVNGPAGTYAVVIRNSGNTRSYVAEFIISPGEASTDVRKSITISGDTSGTWLKDSGLGIQIFWTLAAGASLQTAPDVWTAGNYISTSSVSNFVGTASNTFELFDVGLYEGEQAPNFEVPNYIDELRKCQRYFQKIRAGTPSGFFFAGVQYITTLALFACNFPVRMRAAPTLSNSALAGFNVLVPSNTGAVSAIVYSGVSDVSVRMDVTTAALSPGPCLLLTMGSGGEIYANARF